MAQNVHLRRCHGTLGIPILPCSTGIAYSKGPPETETCMAQSLPLADAWTLDDDDIDDDDACDVSQFGAWCWPVRRNMVQGVAARL